VTDWLWSTATYGAAMIAAAGAAGVIWPLRWLHRKSRTRALIMLVIGIGAAYAITRITPSTSTSAAANAIDEFAPAFHFREHHDITIAAPPDRVFTAIKAVSADEIALFNLFTGIRRFGQPGPESVLNAPDRQPILEVAVRTGFVLLADRPPREVVIGAVVVAPPGTRRPAEFTSHDYQALVRAGFAKATMNFLVQDLGNGSSRVDTETRVFANDQATLDRFTPYWRVIFPGSSILRATWLRAIKTRAEKASS
jgi:hypothetical protein